MDLNIESSQHADALSTIMNQLGTSPEVIENLVDPISHKVEEPKTFINTLYRADNIPIDKNEDGELYRTDLSYPEDEVP